MKIQNEMADTFITDNDGIRMKKADMQMFGEALRRQFPEGLVIPLPDYRLADLMDLKDDLDNEREFMRDDVTFDGLVEARNEHIVTDGTLKAELRIPPEYYGRIYPDEESYPLDGREADAMDWEDRAATRLLYEHGNDLSGAAVGVVIREDIMPLLHIEGVPFPEFMQDVQKTNCILDNDARQLMALKALVKQPLDGEISVHECLQPLLAPVMDKYERSLSTPEERRAYSGELVSRAERLLTNSGLTPIVMSNFQASFQGTDAEIAARETTKAVNGRYAPMDAFAVRKGNEVEVSLFTNEARKREQIMNIFRCNMQCKEIADKPFRNLEYKQRAVVYCTNGQLLHGHVGVEGLQSTYYYGLTAMPSSFRLTETPQPERSAQSFYTDDKVQRFRRSFWGGYMPVMQFNHMADFTRQTVVKEESIVLSHDSERGIDRVEVMGQVKGYPFMRKELDEADTKVYIRYQSQFNNEHDTHIITAMMLDKYFAPEIEAAYANEQQLTDDIHDRLKEQKKVWDRITHPALYGKADNIRVRCMIDGVQQSGRPLAPQDAKELEYLSDIASSIGRDTLNYRNHLHENRIIEIAANAYSDILSQQQTQDRTQGLGR